MLSPRSLIKTVLYLTNFLGAVGRRTQQLLLYPLDLTVFGLKTLAQLRTPSRVFERATRGSVVTQIIFTGVDALPTVTLVAFAIGAGLVSQLIAIVRMFGTNEDVVQVLSQVVALELGPLFTAILIIGRSSSAIAVDLGNMKLNREVEGLWLVGINTDHLLVAPRLLATAISQLALAVYFTLIAIVSGVVVVGAFASFGYIGFLADIPLALPPEDLGVFLLKNLAFGLISGTTACYHGLQVKRSPTEVPQQTQRAIVNALTLIFIFDGLLALTQL